MSMSGLKIKNLQSIVTKQNKKKGGRRDQLGKWKLPGWREEERRGKTESVKRNERKCSQGQIKMKKGEECKSMEQQQKKRVTCQQHKRDWITVLLYCSRLLDQSVRDTANPGNTAQKHVSERSSISPTGRKTLISGRYKSLSDKWR